MSYIDIAELHEVIFLFHLLLVISYLYVRLIWASIVLQGCWCLCSMLAAPAWRFVCCTEAVAEMKEPVETDGKNPEPPEPEPVQAVVAQEPGPTENGSNQPQPGGAGEQAESASATVNEEDPCSPPPPGKYSSWISFSPMSLLVQVHVSTPLADQMLLKQAMRASFSFTQYG